MCISALLPVTKENKGWDLRKCAVARGRPVNRDLSAVDDYPQWLTLILNHW